MTEPVKSPARAEAVRDLLKSNLIEPGHYATATVFARGRAAMAAEALTLLSAPASPPAEALPSQTSGVEAARAAVERLANVQMNISLAEWSQLSSTILAALPTDKLGCYECGGDGLIVTGWDDDAHENIEGPCPRCAALAKPASEPAGDGVRVTDEMVRRADGAYCASRRNHDGPLHSLRVALEAALSSPASSSPADAEALQAGVDAVRIIADLLDENAECYSENAMDRAFLGNSEKLAELVVGYLSLSASLSTALLAGAVDLAAAIGTSEFMDPPDGGDVPLVEQVRRMAKAYKQRGDDIVALMAALDAEKGDRRKERAARMSFLGAAREALTMSGLTHEQVIIADNAISEAFRRVREEARHDG